MSPKPFVENDSIEGMWDDLGYAYGRVSGDTDAKDLAPQLLALIEASEDLWKGQRLVWRAETLAQSGVDAVNYRADIRTDDFSEDLRHANRKHPQAEERQSRYFPIAKYKIIDLGLATQMSYIEDYASSLPKEPESELQSHGKGFAEDAVDGRAALLALTVAVANRRDQRSKDIAIFRKKANEVRTEVYGELLKRSAKGKPKGWADEFFRRRRQNSPEERRLEKLRDTLFTSCELYGLTLEEEQQKKILQEINAEALLRWLRNSASAKTAADLFSAAS